MEMVKVVRPFCSGEQCKGRRCCSDFVAVLVFSARFLTKVLKDPVHGEANMNDLTTILYINVMEGTFLFFPLSVSEFLGFRVDQW
ncbi:hypothetical protein Hdeb2414_s0008g00290481 [Helianthus debilis subsp. tardiflorus]